MQRFVAEQNIQNFKAQLSQEQDESRRAFLRRLISEEEAKLVAATRKGPESEAK